MQGEFNARLLLSQFVREQQGARGPRGGPWAQDGFLEFLGGEGGTQGVDAGAVHGEGVGSRVGGVGLIGRQDGYGMAEDALQAGVGVERLSGDEGERGRGEGMEGGEGGEAQAEVNGVKTVAETCVWGMGQRGRWERQGSGGGAVCVSGGSACLARCAIHHVHLAVIAHLEVFSF